MEIIKTSKICAAFKKLFSSENGSPVFATFSGCFPVRALISAMSAVSGVFTGCFLYRLLAKDDCFAAGMRSSAIFGFINKIIQGIISFFSKLYSFLFSINEDSLNRRAFNAVCRKFDLTYENFLGVVFIAFSLVPGSKWNNAYGLGAALIVAFLYVVALFGKKNLKCDIRGFSFSLLVFMMTCFVAVITSSERGDSLRVLTFFVTSFLFTLVIAGSLTDEDKIDNFTGFIYVGVLLTSVICVIQSAVGIEFDSQLVDIASSGNISRAFSTFENPNNYAEYLILLMPFSAAFALNRKGFKRVLLTLLLLIPFAALVLTYSRSCWVSFAISIIVFILLYDYRVFPYLIVICLVALPFLPATIRRRLTTIGNMEDTSNHYRVEIWQGALRMIKKHGLSGTGLGPAAFAKYYRSYAVPSAITAPHSHMLYLEIFLEAGILSILSFICWWLMTLKRGITVLISKKNISGRLKNVIIASIASFTSMIFVSGVEYIWFYPRVMITFFIAAGITLAALGAADSGRAGKE